MKIRMGFVSNSSSCSFTISKKGLTEEQISQIKNHIKAAKKLAKQGKVCYTDASTWHLVGKKNSPDVGTFTEGDAWDVGDAWDIKDQGDKILVGTTITNFDLEEFVKVIGVPEENISGMTDSWWPEPEPEEEN